MSSNKNKSKSKTSSTKHVIYQEEVDAFIPRRNMIRTPPENSLSNSVDDFNCKQCDRRNNADNMVQCDGCKLWFHYGCAGVDDDIKHHEWFCSLCVEKLKRKAPSSSKSKSLISDKAKSKSSKASSQRRRDLELQKLADERALQERIDNEEFDLRTQMLERKKQREKQFLEKKLLLDLVSVNEDSEESLDNDDNNEEGENEKVTQWLANAKQTVSEDVSVNPANDFKDKKCGNHIKEYSRKGTNNEESLQYPPGLDFPQSSKQGLPSLLNQNIKGSQSYVNVSHASQITTFQSLPSVSVSNVDRIKSHKELENKHKDRPLDPITTIENLNSSSTCQPLRPQFSTTAVTFNNPMQQSECKYQPLRNTSYNHQPVVSHYNPPKYSVASCNYIPTATTNGQMSYSLPTVSTSNEYYNTDHYEVSQPASALPGSYITPQQISSRHILSKIQLNFSGQPEDWPLFISTFSRISEQCGLSDDEKLVKLNDALKGQARERVKSLLIEPSNVPNIIETLRMLYGRPSHIIQSLLKKCRDQPGPKEGKLQTFIEFAVVVENLCCTMRAANLHAHLNNPDLVQELISKLPDNFKIDWPRTPEAADPNVTLNAFSGWLSSTARCISNVTTCIVDYPKAIKQDIKRKGYLNAHDAENGLKNKSHSDSNKFGIKLCRICNNTCNSPSKCNMFEKLDFQSRWAKVKEYKLCYFCLKNHGGRRCRIRGICGVNDCTRRHNKLLHDEEFIKNQIKINEKPSYNPLPKDVHIHNQTKLSVLFRIVPVVLYGLKNKINTYAFLDEGSSLTLMEEHIAQELGLNGTLEPLCLKWTGNVKRHEEDSKKVNLEIASTSKPDKRYSIFNAHTVKSLELPVQSINASNMIHKYPHLRDISFESYEQVKPRILIGIDNGSLGLPRGYREGRNEEPIATKTKLGWIVHGVIKEATNNGQQLGVINHHLNVCSCNYKDDSDIHQLVKNYFSIESMGIDKPENTIESIQEKRARHILESSTKREGDRFKTGLLWSSDNVYLPNSLPMAMQRMECLERRLRKNKALAENLQSQIREYINSGYIRKLSETEIQHTSQKTWYLPVFPVVNPNKPAKIRIVWDAAATVQGISLNSVLLKGPDLLNSLLHILFRFREKRIAICGDIKQMFHQVQIQESDQDAQRFIWRNIETNEIEHYKMLVMTFGAKCSPSSAQFVLNQNASSFQKTNPRAVWAIKENHYVDDYLDSVNNEEEAIKLGEEIQSIHHHGGFQIRNWISNSSKVLEKLENKSIVEHKDLNIIFENRSEKVLGMWWCTTNDTFSFSISTKPHLQMILKQHNPPTKRQVLKIVMSIFDPLGMLAHYVIYVKVLLQQIWRAQIAWDEEINDHQNEKWKRWVSLLPDIEKISIPRCYSKYLNPEICDVQLHIFVDASEDASAAVGFLRFEQNKVVECALVGAKTKVAPLKLLSIPRLELEAALLGSRLATNISNSLKLKISSRHFWSDNKSVLCWIRADHKKYSKYVAFRISELLENCEIQEWRWVPTKLNVADEATKWEGGKNVNLDNGSRWFTGPDFLYSSEENWPVDLTVNESTTEELKKVVSYHATDETLLRKDENILAHSDFQSSDITGVSSILSAEDFSTWQTLLRRMAYILRAVQNMRSRKL